MTQKWQTLLEYRRAELTEVEKCGALAWVSGNNLVHAYGENILCYGRSTVKPVHMKVFVHELDPLLTWEQKAASVSSHCAEPFQLRVIKEILRPEEKKYMQTPAEAPSPSSHSKIKRPNRWYHTCSGEHTAIIRGCQRKGWSMDYTSLEHPFRHHYLEYVRGVLGPHWAPKHTAVDGCGLQTVSFSLAELATVMCRLSAERERGWIWEAMTQYPEFVGGPQRLDSAIMQACQGKVLAKEGADGLLGMSLLHDRFPDGLGIAIKLAHGSDDRAMWFLARKTLGVLGFDIPMPPKPLHRQVPFVPSNIVPNSLRDDFEMVRLHSP